ncbi:MAG: glutamine amidotransferase, partial [Omnitrophica WOR_2 bacterium]
IGGGRYHFTADPGSIPSIFTEETTLATRAYLVEDPFYPKLSAASPILDSIQQIPQLLGYVGTSAKPAAETILVSPKGDPILAAWQYGLGKAVAFTSDATGHWAKDWVGWKLFPTFWSQAVRYTMREPSQYPLDVQVSLQGENAHLTVDAFQRPEPGAPANALPYLDHYALEAKILAPGGQAADVLLNQTAPGRYEGDFQPGDQGAYLIQITGRSSNPAASSNSGDVEATAGWVLSYSPEYQDTGSNPGALVQIAQVSGGKVASGDPSQVFEHTLVSQKAPQPIWPWLLALAAILLPFDIGVRRLVITRSEFQRFIGKSVQSVKSFLRFRKNLPVPERSAQMDSLLRLKERPRPDRTPEKSMPERLAIPANPATNQKLAEKETGNEDDHQETGETPTNRPSTASTLLAKKRARQSGPGEDRPKPD